MNRRIFILTCIWVYLAVVLVTGCASTRQMVPVASGPIPSNSARIIVLREGGFAGSAAPIGITDNGKQIGDVGLHSQLVWDRIAGSMQLVGFHADAPDHRTPPIQICVGAGMTYQFMASWPALNNHNYPKIELVSGTPVACEQVQQPSATSTATTDKQMITQNSTFITAAIPSDNQNILGISVEPTSGVRGVVVKTVTPGSPCEGVLKSGDTIFAFDLIGQGDSRVGGAKVNANNFQAEVSKIQQGMTVKLLLNLRPVREVICTIPEKAQPATPPVSSATSPKQ